MKPALIYTGLVIITCCVCRGSTANTESGYRYEYVHPLLEKGILSSPAATTHHLNWTPYRRSFQALLRDVLLERQALTGLLPTLGVVAGVGGVSVKDLQ